ncbi:hypothetical protein EHQ68_15525 [Leptospira congkakensis]|uniref:Uncharacterized protein n=2 Tax=Leptospira congkakensis TaxID=2484932 RepID=A0A8B5NAB6_9LEPT|nr:hypothetical protein [Leptospira congkakensis]TGL86706.1 hypothetical protein EHQ68_15525 [Leptospira congkakensis]TGL93749.1 hypothetical protein EHQ69_04505 [Leptospira congkakensis]
MFHVLKLIILGIFIIGTSVHSIETDCKTIKSFESNGYTFDTFPSKFQFGKIDYIADCEEIIFHRSGIFYYRFTGCLGTRAIRGTWKKSKKGINFTGTFKENDSEITTQCISDYHTSDSKVIKDCFNRLKNNLLIKYGKYPLKFLVSGNEILDKKNIIILNLNSTLDKPISGKSISGPLNIENEEAGCFLNSEEKY